jgi:hypothetical protein
MAISRRGCRPITITDVTYHWRLLRPQRSDCPLCAAWHVLVLTGEGLITAEFVVEVDPETERPRPVTPRLVAARIAEAVQRAPVAPPPPRRKRARVATRHRHHS